MIHSTEEGMVFTAISERAMQLFEDRMGRGLKQLVVEGNPQEVFEMFPPGWIVQTAKNNFN
jgi:hypothetical protein